MRLSGFGLVGLQLRADVAADVHVRNVYRQNLKGCPRLQALAQNGFGDRVGVLEHDLVAVGRTDGGDDTLAYARNDGLLARAADQAVYVGADRDFGLGAKLYAVLAMAAMTGVSMTFGLTLICTASSTLRPARSMAAARSNSSGMSARCAAIRESTTRSTLPPAR